MDKEMVRVKPAIDSLLTTLLDVSYDGYQITYAPGDSWGPDWWTETHWIVEIWDVFLGKEVREEGRSLAEAIQKALDTYAQHKGEG